MKFILYTFNLLLCLSARALLRHIRQNKTDSAQANSFISGAFMLRRTISCAATTHLNAVRSCPSRYVAMHTIAAPQTLVPKCLEYLSDEFFFKFFINFRPRVFVFARQPIVKFRHIAAAFAVELDRVSPYGAVF